MKRFALKALPAIPLLVAAFSAQALTPGSGTWVKETATYGTPNLQDAYVYVPSNAAPAVKNGKRALMLTLHGCVQTASGNVISNKYNWEKTAEQYGMVVIAPTVPTGTSSTRTVSGCWDWFGSNHTRSTRDEGVLLKLIDSVKARANLDIDPNQIYVTGLSSGGGVAADLACVAPDYFAGAGLAAAPVFNTPSNAGLGSKNAQTPSQIAANCKAAAGSYASAFATQITSVVNGTQDTFVDPTHDQGNEDGMKALYGATTSAGTFTETNSSGRLWSDASGKVRVSRVEASGMAHAWPAGSGGSGGGTYVDYTHVNYPAYVTKFFFDNNLRVAGGGTPGTTTTTTAGSGTTTTTSTTTTTTAPPSGSCFKATNYAHVLAGRARDVWGFAYANGSNQFMGMDGIFFTTKLRMTGANTYVVDSSCP
ncbi:MAG: PHB depolymerase family esterase [Betaproteobacteria bacterium]